MLQVGHKDISKELWEPIEQFIMFMKIRDSLWHLARPWRGRSISIGSIAREGVPTWKEQQEWQPGWMRVQSSPRKVVLLACMAGERLSGHRFVQRKPDQPWGSKVKYPLCFSFSKLCHRGSLLALGFRISLRTVLKVWCPNQQPWYYLVTCEKYKFSG